jgi:CDP-diacylglycerol---serine O-phosphatidyltransferase
MQRHIPNFLTCCNLVCGCLGIIALLEGKNIPLAYFVWAACIFDFLDGFAARVLKISSPIGKELDSLADMVSFGVLPALLMYTTISLKSPVSILPYAGLIIAVASAIRLAIFNLDATQSDSFKGLPTPANAIFITAIPFLDTPFFDFVHTPLVLAAICVVFSLLLVSRIDLFALKFKNFSWSDNKVRFTFLVIAVLLLAILRMAALPLIILSYIAISLGVRMLSK